MSHSISTISIMHLIRFFVIAYFIMNYYVYNSNVFLSKQKGPKMKWPGWSSTCKSHGQWGSSISEVAGV